MQDLRTQAAQHEAADRTHREALVQRLSRRDALIGSIKDGYIGSVCIPNGPKVCLYYDSSATAEAAHQALAEVMDGRVGI